MYVKIKSIKKNNKLREVYDIVGVPNNHNIIAGDMVVHNCDEAMNFMCLTDDTLIKMPRDIKKYKSGVPIKDLVGKKDFKVYSFNTKNKKIELRNCKGCVFIKEADVYELELKTGQKIKATADHKFVTKTGEIKKLKDLVIFKDKLILFSEYYEYVKSIKFIGKKKVYSLVEVSKNHNYFANNILVMNSAMDHNKVESKEMKKLITVVRPRRLFMIANIPELMWVDSKYRDIFAHFWIYAIEKGHAFIFEKNKAVTKDKWGLKYLEKHMGVVKYFTNTDKIKRSIKRHPCYFDSISWSELPEKVYNDYEYVRNARNLQRQVEEMELSNLDIGKIMAWNLLNEWDRIQLEVNKSKGNKMTYNILRHEILINPVTRKPMSSETTVRNWVIGMEQYLKTKGQNSGVFAPKGL